MFARDEVAKKMSNIQEWIILIDIFLSSIKELENIHFTFFGCFLNENHSSFNS